MPESRKILAFQPLVCNAEDERFRVTNLGALVEGLNQCGHTAIQVAFAPNPERVGKTERKVLLCSEELASSPDWWAELRPWAVVTNTWGAPRFAKYIQAIKGATHRVLDRLDTDGNRSPNISFQDYLFRETSALRDYTSPSTRMLAFPLALARTTVVKMLPGLLDIPVATAIANCPLVGAESPIAVERMKRLMYRCQKNATHIHCIPFPVNESGLQFSELADRQNFIVSIGRWNSNQKNFPLMLEVLERFLETHQNWSAILPGALPPAFVRLVARHAPRHGARIHLPGPLPHKDIYRLLSTAKIFLMTSQHESFGIAAAEALCSGCSIVGPHHIPSIPWFCGSDSGTAACRYTAFDIADALGAEAHFWEAGLREPKQISHGWKARVSASSVAKKVITLLETL